MSDENYILSVDNIGKHYPIIASARRRPALVWSLLSKGTVPNAFCALADVTFALRRGECLGVVGENGAGKSTLLKIIAGVSKPTAGTVQRQGTVGALLELGAGFHPEYTGRANIDLAAALLGLGDNEIASKREGIARFAELGSHLDEPLKTYSSGMVVRLGFAVATAIRPDLLITDEVLAVGDASFQKKCVAWIEEFLSSGGTLLMCSHSMYHVQKLCARCIWLKNGRIIVDGATPEVVQQYLAYHEEKLSRRGVASKREVPSQDGSIAVQFEPNNRVMHGQPLCLEGTVHTPRRSDTPVVVVQVYRADGTCICTVRSDENENALRKAQTGFTFSVTFDALPLLPGKYFVEVHAKDSEGAPISSSRTYPLTVTGDTRELGLVRLEHRWTCVTDQ
jgi:lipopolysaccharide transport system ATP-binding protein